LEYVRNTAEAYFERESRKRAFLFDHLMCQIVPKRPGTAATEENPGPSKSQLTNAANITIPPRAIPAVERSSSLVFARTSILDVKRAIRTEDWQKNWLNKLKEIFCRAMYMRSNMEKSRKYTFGFYFPAFADPIKGVKGKQVLLGLTPVITTFNNDGNEVIFVEGWSHIGQDVSLLADTEIDETVDERAVGDASGVDLGREDQEDDN
jgi:hypothetical protein